MNIDLNYSVSVSTKSQEPIFLLSLDKILSVSTFALLMFVSIVRIVK